MFDDTKLKELDKKIKIARDKQHELTREVDKELRELRAEFFAEQRKKEAWLKEQKQKGKPGYMNIIFKWDSGITFDTRTDKLIMFKEYVFAYGLPTDFEVRG